MIKLIKKGWMEHLEAYKKHCIDQAITILTAGHDIKCMFATPKLLEVAVPELGGARHEHCRESASPASFPAAPSSRRSGRGSRRGTLRRPARRQRHLHDAHLRQHADGPGLQQAGHRRGRLQDPTTHRSRGPSLEVVDFDDADQVVDYGETGRVKLTTLTKEFFVPGFLERDEGEREPPYERYPWDGVSGVRPFHELAEATTVGVY